MRCWGETSLVYGCFLSRSRMEFAVRRRTFKAAPVLDTLDRCTVGAVGERTSWTMWGAVRRLLDCRESASMTRRQPRHSRPCASITATSPLIAAQVQCRRRASRTLTIERTRVTGVRLAAGQAQPCPNCAPITSLPACPSPRTRQGSRSRPTAKALETHKTPTAGIQRAPRKFLAEPGSR